MNDWMWARSAAMRSAARTCCMARSVRMRTNSSKPPGVTVMRPRSRKAIACTARSSRHAVVRDQQHRAGEAREPGLQPQRGFQVEVVGRFVEQQQVGGGEQRGGERHAHAPAAGEFLDRALLRGLVEAQAGEDGGGAGGCGIGADRAQAFVDLGQADGRSAVSASASRARRSGSPCRTVSSSEASPEGASWATVAMRARAARRISPPSSGISPAMARSRVDLPAPLRPTRPMRRPWSTVRSAPFRMARPPRRMAAPEMTRSGHGGG